MRFVVEHLRLTLVALIAAVLLFPVSQPAGASSMMDGMHQMAGMGQMMHPSGPTKAALDLCKQHCLAGFAILPGLSAPEATRAVAKMVYPTDPLRPAFDRPEPQGPPPKRVLS